MKGKYLIKCNNGGLKNFEYLIKSIDKDIEKMSDMEKLVMSIKTDSMSKVILLADMILGEEGNHVKHWSDDEKESFRNVLQTLMFRLDLGIDKIAKMFAKDQTKLGLPIYPKN